MAFRAIEGARGAWGLALLCAPRATLQRAGARRADHRAVVVTRILGARQLTQAVLSGVNPSPEVLAMGVWVDAAHCATAVGLALADRSRARSGLADAVVAGAWAVVGYRDLRHADVPRASHDKRRDELARWVLHRMPGGRPLARRAASLRAEHS